MPNKVFQFVKRPVKKLLLYALNVPDLWQDLRQLTAEWQSGTIADVGANRGQTALKLVQIMPRWQIVAFEPFPATYQTLVQAVASYRQVKPINIALSDSNGTANFHSFSADVTNSLLSANATGQTHFASQLNLETVVKVQTQTLDSWSKQEKIDDLYTLKLDVQGAELLVLKGAQQLLSTTIQVVLTEVQFIHLYEGSALFRDVESFLAALDFQLYQLYNLQSGNNGQLLFGDAIFVRNQTGTAKVTSEK
jgi:FkbM family methyltransferase